MEGILNKLSLYDFFVALFSGSIFLTGIQLSIFDIIGFIYGKSENNALSYVILIISAYVIGVAIQSLSSCVLSLTKFQHNKLVKKCLSDSNVVGNNAKLKVYLKKAENLFKKKELYEIRGNTVAFEDFNDENHIISKENLEEYFFNYCIYFLQVNGKDSKPELMRSAVEMSGSLSVCFIFLAIFKILSVLIIASYTFCNFICPVIFMAISVIFWFVNKKNIYNRIRIVLGIYDALTD